MNKQEYLSAIRVRIPKMPTEDMERFIAYYSEMIDDRMEDGSVGSAGHMANGGTPSGFELQISDSAWEKANPGTYRATVTFTAQLAFSE